MKFKIPFQFSAEIITNRRIPRFTARLITIGLILVVISLSSLSLWIAFSNQQAISKVQTSISLDNLLSQALLTVHKEELFFRDNQIRPGTEVRSSSKNASAELISHLNEIRTKVNATEQVLIDGVLATHQIYLAKIEQLYAAVDANYTTSVLALYAEEDLLLNKIVNQINQITQDHITRTNFYLAELEGSQQFILIATPIVLICGLGMIAFFSFLLRTYWRQSLADKILNKELQLVNESITRTLEKEKELNELKSRFITMASHEFRTPLTGILATAELLDHYCHKWSVEKRKELFGRIQKAGGNLARMLDDVLIIGKAEAGKLEFQPTWLNLTRFCQAVVEEIQVSITSGSFIHFVSEPESIEGLFDERLLHRILNNLLINAIKYSVTGNPVYFKLSCQDNQVVFEIKDQGIGIPPLDQSKVFENFHRASNVGTIAGTGLGLAIVKKAVDAHAGQIALTSEVGVGTTFTVRLPLMVLSLSNSQ
ncbi:MAG: HAMP domain-containing histidine kinase [Chloroflexi bacterium]|nr:HAMP domain-containing histidine kinase [Chloroflexota bacterium]MBN9397451.1 HAMP domain-containing histidine kinase [Candidatus Melainabacteria bacterium]OJW05466.1 MAG: hypothetical protein BGO39_15900 [Chloroflexi bacterium 54-19]